MADQKLSALAATANIDDTSEMYINEGGVSKKILGSDIKSVLGGGSGAFTADINTQITPSTAIVLDQASGDEIALDLSYQTNKLAGSDTGLRINQTDTLSPGTSNLIDLQVGGSSKFRVDNSGYIYGPSRYYLPATTLFLLESSSVAQVRMTAGNFSITNTLNFKDGNASTGTLFASLEAEAANTLALRNSTNAQSFHCYNTFTDLSNYERGFMKWNTNVLEIGAEAAGTGTARALRLQTGANIPVYLLDSNNNNLLNYDGSGQDTDHLLIQGHRGINFYANGPTGFDMFYFGQATATAEMSGSSGTQAWIGIDAEVNQTSTAGYTGIKLDVTETATGSGAKLLLDLQVGSTSKFNVTNTGVVEHAAGFTVAGLPSGTVGQVARVTDASNSALGATVAGSGSQAAMVWYDGSAWRVMGTDGGAANETLVIACSDETTALTTGTGKVTFRMPYAMTLSEVRASVTTAPVGSTLTVDINEGGVSILSTVISIDASEKTSTTAATAPVISDSALADDAEITIDIDQIGSSTAGAGLKVYLIGTRT